ncbi:unnamed protein product [Choristocarpus tenellus]
MVRLSDLPVEPVNHEGSGVTKQVKSTLRNWRVDGQACWQPLSIYLVQYTFHSPGMTPCMLCPPFHQLSMLDLISKILFKVMVINGQVPHLTGFSRSVFKPGQSVLEHTHEKMDEVFYVQEGQGTFVVDNVMVQATGGTCVHVPAGQPHQITNNGKEDMIVLYLGISKG